MNLNLVLTQNNKYILLTIIWLLVIPIIVTTTAIVSGRPRIINTWLSVLILPGLLSDGASIADIVFSIPNSQPDRSAKPSFLQLIQVYRISERLMILSKIHWLADKGKFKNYRNSSPAILGVQNLKFRLWICFRSYNLCQTNGQPNLPRFFNRRGAR